MDALIRTVFNTFLTSFCEPLAQEGIQLSFLDGIIVRDLKIKPEAINSILEKQEADLRIDGGQIGFLRICYTALPGVVTMQLSGIDLRLRPNAIKTLGKTFKKSILGLFTPEDPLDANPENFPLVQSDGRLILSPFYHEPTQCIYHRQEVQQAGITHHYFCDRCILPLHNEVSQTQVFHIVKIPTADDVSATVVKKPRHIPRMDVEEDEIVFVSPQQMQHMLLTQQPVVYTPPSALGPLGWHDSRDLTGMEKRKALTHAMRPHRSGCLMPPRDNESGQIYDSERARPYPSGQGYNEHELTGRKGREASTTDARQRSVTMQPANMSPGSPAHSPLLYPSRSVTTEAHYQTLTPIVSVQPRGTGRRRPHGAANGGSQGEGRSDGADGWGARDLDGRRTAYSTSPYGHSPYGHRPDDPGSRMPSRLRRGGGDTMRRVHSSGFSCGLR